MIGSDKTKLLINHDTIQIDPVVQQMLNTPLKKEEGIDPADVSFLQMLVDKVDSGEIRAFLPNSLINDDVYDKLPQVDQGKADYNAYLMLGKIREIHSLYKLGHHDSYQILNLVHSLRVNKENLEHVNGDIYII